MKSNEGYENAKEFRRRAVLDACADAPSFSSLFKVAYGEKPQMKKKIYQVDYNYAWDAPRQNLGAYSTREAAEKAIEDTKDKAKYPNGFHGDDLRIYEMELDG